MIKRHSPKGPLGPVLIIGLVAIAMTALDAAASDTQVIISQLAGIVVGYSLRTAGEPPNKIN